MHNPLYKTSIPHIEVRRHGDSAGRAYPRPTSSRHRWRRTYCVTMGDDPTTAEDSPTFQDVLEALEDPECRAILRNTAEPMTASELLNTCDISRSTLYRKLELLSSAALLEERERINQGGGRVTHYERSFEDVTISIEEDGEFSVAIEREAESSDERLADIWSMMGDGL
ncbi:MAG: putative transcriptional regulator [Natronomonas sp.]|jgi:predicted transcriptional regulator